MTPGTFDEVRRAEAGFTTGLGKFSAKFEAKNGTVKVQWDTPISTEGYVQLPGHPGQTVDGGKGSTIIKVA